jgi:YD repeat-containing protein
MHFDILSTKIMRIFQHILLFIILSLSFSYAAVSQANVSDTKLEGLKGQVKSLVSTSKSISGYAEWVLKDKTKYQSTYLFNRKGDLTESTHEGGSNTKYVYSKIDGYKTFKMIQLKTPENNGNRFAVLGAKEEEPIEPNEKLTEPDKRFDFKYVYETDNSGRMVSERQYQNNGKLFRKRTYEYNKAGVLTKETEEDTIARMTYSFTYDDKGNVVEVNKTRDIKGPGSDSKERITYTEFKFDSVGNWTERKSTRYSRTDAMPQYKIPAETYTLVDVESRTLTYY